jgi:hypothetical protein
VFDLVTHGGGKVILECAKVALFEKSIEVKKVLGEQYFSESEKPFLKFSTKFPNNMLRPIPFTNSRQWLGALKKGFADTPGISISDLFPNQKTSGLPNDLLGGLLA